MCCLKGIDDPRQPSNGARHDFQEIHVIAIAAVLSDCDTIKEIAYWGRKKAGWLGEFLVLENGKVIAEGKATIKDGGVPLGLSLL